MMRETNLNGRKKKNSKTFLIVTLTSTSSLKCFDEPSFYISWAIYRVVLINSNRKPE